MKRFAIPALAALALAACSDSTPEAADAAAGTEADTAAMAPAPTATETTVVTTPAAGTATTAADTSDKVSIGPDGVKADVGDADTRVKVDTKSGTINVED